MLLFLGLLLVQGLLMQSLMHIPWSPLDLMQCFKVPALSIILKAAFVRLFKILIALWSGLHDRLIDPSVRSE